VGVFGLIKWGNVVKYDVDIKRIKVIHRSGIINSHLMGDKWGINVHPEVTLAWQANDI